MLASILPLLALLTGAPISQEEEPLAAWLEALPERLETERARRGWPSLSLAVVRGDETLFAGAIGLADLEDERAAGASTVYPIGSITKLLTGSLLVRLVDAGTVRYHTPVAELVPEYRVRSPFPGTRPTTLWQLATHTSGLPRTSPAAFWGTYTTYAWILTGGEAATAPPITREQRLEALAETELEHRPFAPFGHYSNLGFHVLGAALERAAGKPYGELVERDLLGPLGMESSRFAASDLPAERLAVRYLFTGSGGSPLVVGPSDGEPSPAGGLLSTAEDMARFVRWQLWTGAADESHPLGAEGLRLMRAAPFSWVLRYDPEAPGFEHTGGVLGASAYLGVNPDRDVGLVLLTNTFNPLQPDGSFPALGRRLLDELQRAVAPGSPPPFDPAAVDPERFVGRYELRASNAVCRLTLDEEGFLVHELEGLEGSAARLVPVGDLRFAFEADPGRNAWVVFEEDAGGRVAFLAFTGQRFARVGD